MKLKQARQFQSKSGKLISFKWKWQSGDLKKSRHKKVASSPHLNGKNSELAGFESKSYNWKNSNEKSIFESWHFLNEKFGCSLLLNEKVASSTVMNDSVAN